MTRPFDEFTISKNIIDSYYRKLQFCLDTDVAIVGAGPSGLLAGAILAERGHKVVLIESKLSPGGGVWGGGMGMNEIVFQPEAEPLLHYIGVSYTHVDKVMTADAVELSAALILKALKNGAKILNLITAEDLCILGDRVTGVVVNRTGISGRYHVDPIMLTSKFVIDGTGHDAMCVNFLNKHGYKINTPSGKFEGEGAMDVVEGERFVVEHTGEVFPGLFVMGMAVCATFNGPRMGPIFGGMLFSGQKVAHQICERLK